MRKIILSVSAASLLLCINGAGICADQAVQWDNDAQTENPVVLVGQGMPMPMPMPGDSNSPSNGAMNMPMPPNSSGSGDGDGSGMSGSMSMGDNPMKMGTWQKLELGMKVILGKEARKENLMLDQVGEGAPMFRIGPENLPVGSMVTAKPYMTQTEEELWLTGFNTQVVDARGNELPGALIHHGIVVNARGGTLNGCGRPSSDDAAKAPEFFMAAGSELTPFSVPAGYGIHVPQGSILATIGDFHNPTGQEYDNVYVTISLATRKVIPGDGVKAVVPMWMSVKDFCTVNDPAPTPEIVEYSAPPGVSENHSQGKFPISGRVIAILPHLHEHAVAMTLTDTTTGDIVWSFKVPFNDDGSMAPLPVYSDAAGPHVNAGDDFTLSATYDVPGDQPFATMALMMLYIAPD